MRVLNAILQGIMAPRWSEVTPQHLFGLPGDPPSRRLAQVPQAVVHGFEQSFLTSSIEDLHSRLALVEVAQRGFAYEGATMGCAILDAMTNRRASRTAGVMSGPGSPHLLLNYIGLGFAMARLPRPTWSRLMPRLQLSTLHPTMSWLAVDGYGFDLGYFNPRAYLQEKRRPEPYPWADDPVYFSRAVDQGLGRAVWFAHGGRVETVSSHIADFPLSRQPDLWSGVGLAATFAGPHENAIDLRQTGSEPMLDVGVGALFAYKGRAHSGHLPAHTRDTMHALTGLAPTEADAAINTFCPTPTGCGGNQYEQWRLHLRTHLEHSREQATSKNHG